MYLVNLNLTSLFQKNCRLPIGVFKIKLWAGTWQNKQGYMCTQQRLRSAWASAQSDQSLCWLQGVSLYPLLPFKRTANTMIRLGSSTGRSEYCLCARTALLILPGIMPLCKFEYGNCGRTIAPKPLRYYLRNKYKPSLDNVQNCQALRHFFFLFMTLCNIYWKYHVNYETLKPWFFMKFCTNTEHHQTAKNRKRNPTNSRIRKCTLQYLNINFTS